MAIKKSKSKEWFTIVTPEYFDEKEIGRTMATDPNTIINRRIVVSLMELANNFSKYYMKFIFRITKINGNKAITEFDGSECLRDYISRMVLRRIRRVDTIQDLTTKDDVKIRVKGLAIVSSKTKTNVRDIIRNSIREMVKKEVESLTLEDFIKKIISDEFKNRVLQEARKIYPVRNFEIRKTEIIR